MAPPGRLALDLSITTFLLFGEECPVLIIATSKNMRHEICDYKILLHMITYK